MQPNFNWQPWCEPLSRYNSKIKNRVDILRLDNLDPVISGNKPLKLAGWFAHFKQTKHKALLSFGGSHSNHLHALSYAAKQLSIPAYLVVRGWETAPLTRTLKDCLKTGAELIFVDKQTYAKRYDLSFQQELAAKYDALVIPEGGAGDYGEQGCYALANLAQDYDEVWLAVGSGATALGLAKGLAQRQAQTRLVGVNAVADQGERLRAWKHEMPKSLNWRLIDDAHCGGFAKQNEHSQSVLKRYEQQGLPLDPVYTAKLILAFERELPTERSVLLIHSGGLQGRE